MFGWVLKERHGLLYKLYMVSNKIFKNLFIYLFIYKELTNNWNYQLAMMLSNGDVGLQLDFQKLYFTNSSLI